MSHMRMQSRVRNMVRRDMGITSRKKKFESCVHEVKKQPGYNPYAVCHASMDRKTHHVRATETEDKDSIFRVRNVPRAKGVFLTDRKTGKVYFRPYSKLSAEGKEIYQPKHRIKVHRKKKESFTEGYRRYAMM